MKIGIVGLPNVGKSTLFNALTGARALVANYAFATIHPNMGVVPVPDKRLAALAKVVGTETLIPATVEFVDIAGLVKGASRGEGLGNQFLSHIREVDAILHVVRCFEDENIVYVGDGIDPIADYRTIEIELILADIAHLERRQAKLTKQAKGHAAEVLSELAMIERLLLHLNDEKSARSFIPSDAELHFMPQLHLLTSKPVLVAANVKETSDIINDALLIELYETLVHENVIVLPVYASIEAEISELNEEERSAFREEMGIQETGLSRIISEGYRVLGRISFFTGNEKEVHAWTIREGTTAPKAAGAIHSDFERGFIRAEVVGFDELVKAGSFNAAKGLGLVRSEGKSYVVRDGDYIIFRFNV
jgi:hypothetical protein